jgi:2-polyprenyl-6-methoxyphenol hydroxylase-like FAD-dependent oxidoreductase
MTDVNGKRHAITLPVGSMNPEVWSKQKAYASQVLPPQYAEAVNKTQQPFIQAITDVRSPQNSFLDGRVLLVGDALAGFRPHTAASTGQAAFDALRMGDWFGGEINEETYHERVLEFSKEVQEKGVMLGERSQFGRHPFAD